MTLVSKMRNQKPSGFSGALFALALARRSDTDTADMNTDGSKIVRAGISF